MQTFFIFVDNSCVFHKKSITFAAIFIKKITNKMAKIVFITGASSGIGAACARKFAQAGYTLLLNARSVDKLQTLKSEVEQEFSA